MILDSCKALDSVTALVLKCCCTRECRDRQLRWRRGVVSISRASVAVAIGVRGCCAIGFVVTRETGILAARAVGGGGGRKACDGVGWWPGTRLVS